MESNIDEDYPPEYRQQERICGSSALAKACSDKPFQYALKLRTGEIIQFTGATLVTEEWITLELDSGASSALPFPCERGIDVRIADIVWVVDAPYGS